MADEEAEEEEEGPVVELGEGEQVDGAPLTRVSSRLYFGIEKSEVERRESGTVLRTPSGPRELGDILAEVDATYFSTRQSFEDTVRDVVGRGPVPTDSDAE